MLESTVALATLVNCKLAFTLQFAMNQNKQKIEARRAVSSVVNGSRVSGGLISSELVDGERKLEIKVEVGASRVSTEATAS